MSFGLVELITLLLSLSGFSLQANPKAPTPDQSLQYAMPDADVVLHVDATAIIGSNYRLLSNLPNQPQIKASPELAKAVRKAVNEVEGLRGLAKTTTGIDLATDISDATLFVQIPPPGRPPEMLAAVRGRFSVATVDKLSKMLGPSVKVGGGAMIEMTQNRKGPFGAIAVTRDGTLLAGGAKAIKDRLADSWRAPRRATGSNLAHVASVLESKPVFAFALTMSPAARKQVVAEFKGKNNFLADLITRHKLFALSLYTDGLGWTWIDSNRAGLDAMAQVSEGMMDMLRAANIAPRGFAKIAMGALESYRGTNKQVDQLIRRKAEIWKLVESYTGDGSFKVAIDKNPATLRLTARATGKSLSDVVPAGMAIPGMLFFVIGKDQPPPPPAIAVPPASTQPPRLSPKPAQPRTR